jgi:hypothetical protein
MDRTGELTNWIPRASFNQDSQQMRCSSGGIRVLNRFSAGAINNPRHEIPPPGNYYANRKPQAEEQQYEGNKLGENSWVTPDWMRPECAVDTNDSIHSIEKCKRSSNNSEDDRYEKSANLRGSHTGSDLDEITQTEEHLG